MTATTTTLALLARAVDYGDTDRICTLLTRDLGKVSARARGARRSRKRFGAALGLFVVGEATVRRGRSAMLGLERFDAREDLSGRIGSDVVKVAHGSYMLELARELWPPEQPDSGLFDLVADALRTLAGVESPSPALLRAFELKLLTVAGLVPNLEQCAGCGEAAETAEQQLWFSLEQGGLVCARCGPASQSISAGVREQLLQLAASPLVEAASAQISLAEARAMRDLMLEVVRSCLGKDLQSLKFISQLRS